MEYNQTLLPLAILLFLTSTWFTLHHAKRRTSLFILLLSIISFGLGSAAVALLPIDLSYASSMNTLSDNGDTTTNNNDDDNHSHNNEGEVNDADNRDITDYTNATEENGSSINDVHSSNNNPTYLPWQITYWTTFFLAWLVLPIARESLLSGYFTLRQRLKDGCRRSFRTISIMACLGILSTIAMAIHLKSVHFVSVVIPVLMALSNTYGLLLVSLLLGNGLVNIPKRLWREACPANELRRTRIMAPIFEEELFEAVMSLEDVEDKVEEVCRTAVTLRESEEEDAMLENEKGDVINLGNGRASRLCCCFWWCCRKRGGGGEYCKVDEVTEFHECLEELVRRKNETADLCSERRTRRGTPRRQNSASSSSNDETSTGGGGNGNGEINTMDIKYLVSLSRQLKRAQERVTSAQLRWNHLMEHSRLFSALMDDRNLDGSIANDDEEEEAGNNNNSQNKNNNNGTAANLLAPSTPTTCYRKLQYTLQRIWIRCLRYPTYRAVSIITATLSAFVLLSEVTLSATKINLSPFSWTLHALDAHREKTNGDTSTQFQLVFQICALIPLVYMSLCVYTCLFQMSLLGPYCLRGNRQSAGVALVFNMQYLVRLQFPLGYNYLLMLKYDMTHCAFSNIMSDMSTIPFFGTSFSVYAPLLILAVCLFTLCDFYPKILRLLGIEHEDALLLGDEDELDGKANEGIQLMKRDTERRNSAAAAAANGASSPEKLSLNGRRNLIV
mmetsp:Transcript_26025/g.54298  ORF Transcript_26025/g.54298 Transcript_26025/m.54298 type:complete len:729 (-) Transcript_26025:217-2403(-)|eukprot:CAMPEP_0196134564 /NCGR_PEP_ID=MMETSP0910-20130528/3437_1 /TAXON_ID=49265 /ORGANISM="Thalassiosira rotula, Strain GSO102" /LENGTH=728 /DNA_ID=CAMNT_0041394525 /DNA_START=638 /DNA_END=2824 /DNA_ORIENTATION=-